MVSPLQPLARPRGDKPSQARHPSELVMNSFVFGMLSLVDWGFIVFGVLVVVWLGSFLIGAVLIQERQVGVVVKRCLPC